ncbi:Zf-FLZ domain-containing protein [Dioscorea alata]|uniref:Zf-FLZ domain-containing protein n=1 Tax=Dioscorea alata TaxID=55571 RepID=A0ACB7V0B6_DIOAL|nr:Zf-FLZ domain-containing protein [Dioscorea alata]
MAGLGVILEGKKGTQVLNKVKVRTLSANPSSSSSLLSVPSNTTTTPFLQACFLCHQPLSHTKDIYMYSEDCRCKQIYIDEEVLLREDRCSLAAAPSSGRRAKSPPGLVVLFTS